MPMPSTVAVTRAPKSTPRASRLVWSSPVCSRAIGARRAALNRCQAPTSSGPAMGASPSSTACCTGRARAASTTSGTAPGAFRLEAEGSQGIDFSYTGTYTVAPDGSLAISIDGTNEIWNGAIDREYKTVMLVDDFQETRSNGQIELNFAIGVRQKPE